MRRLFSRGLVPVASATVGLLTWWWLAGAPAQAETCAYVYDGSFGRCQWLKAPQRIAIGPDGSFYVTSAGTGRVVVFNPKGGYVTNWELPKTAGKQAAPSGIGFAPGNQAVYVTDTAGRSLLKLSLQGAVLNRWTNFPDADPGTLDDPRGLAVAPDGTIFVADAAHKRVLRLGADGKFEQAWRTQESPFDLVLRGDTAYALERDLRNTYKYWPAHVRRYRALDGLFQGEFRRWTYNNQALATDTNGSEWFIGGTPDTFPVEWSVLRLGPKGTKVLDQITTDECGGTMYGVVTGLALDSTGRVYVALESADEILRFKLR